MAAHQSRTKKVWPSQPSLTTEHQSSACLGVDHACSCIAELQALDARTIGIKVVSKKGQVAGEVCGSHVSSQLAQDYACSIALTNHNYCHFVTIKKQEWGIKVRRAEHSPGFNGLVRWTGIVLSRNVRDRATLFVRGSNNVGRFHMDVMALYLKNKAAASAQIKAT